MAKVGGLGPGGELNRIVSSQVQHAQAEKFPLQSGKAALSNQAELDLAELESQAQTVRAGVIRQNGPQQAQSPRTRGVYPWPIRVFRQTVNVQEEPPPQSEQSDQSQQPSEPSSPRIDLMA